MTDNTFDLETFVNLFDTAMTSDNPTVKRAFKNLMLVAALVEAENDQEIGPLRKLIDDVATLKTKITTMEFNQSINKQYPTIPPNWITTWTTTGSNVTAPSYTPTSNNITLSSNYTSASTNSYMTTSTANYADILNMLEEKNYE